MVFAEDMSTEMQELAETTAIQAFQNQQSSPGGNVYCQIAETIRKAFDKQYQSGWNCIVGRSFGAFVTHKIKTYIYFQVVPNVSILLWKGQ